MGFFNKYLGFVCIISLGSFLCGQAIGYYSPVGTPFQVEMQISSELSNWFNTLHSLCAILGGPINQLLIPKIGCKKMTFSTSVVCGVAWVLLSITKRSFYWLGFVARCILGLCTGSFSGVCSMYIVEISPDEYRGAYGVVHQLMITIGIAWAYLLGIFCTWRLLTYLCIIFPCILCVLIWFVPESPRSNLNEDNDVEKESLFQKKFVYAIVSSICLIVFQQFSGINPILTNLQPIFTASGIDLEPSICSFITGIAQVISTCVASFFVQKLGRRPSWIVSAIGQAVGLYLMWAQETWKISPYLALVSLFIDVFCFGLAYGPIPWLIVPELFPDSVRTLAVSLGTALNWLMSSITIYIWPPMSTSMGSWGFFFFGAICTISVVYGFVFMPETKGKEIGEIEEKNTDDEV
ncbi:major facilitator superfamily transporter [Histomonas meleagridis]|uniref:major facilitator superfamily transporter n=1 Tax=Histomonas meleagridis TaxID=135588 RepID=UPI003559EF84|nr:major facilitator superfamily transporter [Histomonas meleagridis]KAH0798159.1 major facilitator superfamily transporter [Histomonas meleagridis]